MQDLSVWNSRINEQECIVENKNYLFFLFLESHDCFITALQSRGFNKNE